MKLVTIGGVAGGASAAARARRLHENAKIILLQTFRLRVAALLLQASVRRQRPSVVATV
jgi:hypothetical protein